MMYHLLMVYVNSIIETALYILIGIFSPDMSLYLFCCSRVLSLSHYNSSSTYIQIDVLLQVARTLNPEKLFIFNND